MPAGEAGLYAALKRQAGRALTLVQARIELFALELEEERLRLGRVLLHGALAFFLLGVGCVLAVAWLALLFPERRVLVVGLAAALFIVGGLAAALAARSAARRDSSLFAASLAELSEDRRRLREPPAAPENGPPPA